MAVLPLSLLDAPLVSVWKSYVASFLNVHATCWGDNNTSSAFYGWELKNIMSYGGQLSLDYQVFACETRSTESVTPQQDVSLASSTMATSVRQKLTAKQSHAAEGGPVETEIRTANWDIINHPDPGFWTFWTHGNQCHAENASKMSCVFLIYTNQTQLYDHLPNNL